MEGGGVGGVIWRGRGGWCDMEGGGVGGVIWRGEGWVV